MSGISDSLEFVNNTGNGNYIKGKKALTLSADYDNNSGVGQSYVSFDTDGSERMRIDSSGQVGIGTSSPSDTLSVNGQIGLFGNDGQLKFNDGSAIKGGNNYGDIRIQTDRFRVYNEAGSNLAMNIDSSGNVGIGTSSPTAKLDVDGQGCFKKNYSFASTNYHIKLKSAYGNGISSYIGNIASGDRMNISAGGYYYGSSLYQLTDGATGMGTINIGEDGTLTYQNTTGATANSTVNPSERLRIDSSGTVSTTGSIGVGRASLSVFTEDAGLVLSAAGYMYSAREGTSSQTHIGFINNAAVTATTVGSIRTSGSATSYNTSSDYRLKTDAQPMTGATARLKALKPVNFEWIADGTRVDGFLAHEAQEVVPECVSGEKDAMQDQEYEVTPAVLDEEGNTVEEAVMGTRSVPDYQGIDQSKLVPLLVATIQELEARITQLENN